MTISVNSPGATTGSALIGGNGLSPNWSVSVPLPSLADGDVLIVFGWGQTQAVDAAGVNVRPGHPAGTLENTGWSITGAGWSTLVDEIGDVGEVGRRSRLFALWRACDGTETGFTVTGDGPTQGWSNSTNLGVGLRVGALRLRSDTATAITVSASPVISTTAETIDDWQPDPTGPVPRDSVGVGLAAWAHTIPGDSLGWLGWSISSAPRGGHWSAQVDQGDPAVPPTLDTPGDQNAPLVAVLAFSDRPAPTGGGFTLGLHFGPRRGGFH